MWDISYLISKTVTARKLKFYKHLDGSSHSSAPFGYDNFFRKGASQGCSAPSVNLGPSYLGCLFVDHFASNYFYVFHCCTSSTRLLSRSWVKVKRRSKLCEGQPLIHSPLRCCLVGDIFSFKIKVGVYEKLAKNNDCSTKTYAAPLAATSIFRTALRLAFALAMYAGLAHSARRSWCGVISSPATTFAVVIKPPRGRLSQRRGPLPK